MLSVFLNRLHFFLFVVLSVLQLCTCVCLPLFLLLRENLIIVPVERSVLEGLNVERVISPCRLDQLTSYETVGDIQSTRFNTAPTQSGTDIVTDGHEQIR